MEVPEVGRGKGQGLQGAFCPDGSPWVFHPESGKCFQQVARGSVWGCELEVCRAVNGSLACIGSANENAFVVDHVLLPHTFSVRLGLYQDLSGPNATGGPWDRWTSRCESEFRWWAPGQPNDQCSSEDCAELRPSFRGLRGAWNDRSCHQELPCLCEYRGLEPATSASFHDHRPALQAAAAAREPCTGLHSDECTWLHESHFYKIPFGAAGIVCLLLMLFVEARLVRPWRKSGLPQTQSWQRRFNPTSQHGEENPYGVLLDRGGAASHASVGDDVNRWVRRGSKAAMVYGGALAALSLTTTLHLVSGAYGALFLLDVALTLAMFASKAVVAHSCHVVHRHLSPLARAVAGLWVAALGGSKCLMALDAAVLCAAYVYLLTVGTLEELCVAGNIFVCSLLIALVCQTAAGLALERLHTRAALHTGDWAVFSRVVGGWWIALVSGTFGVGMFLALTGYLLVWRAAGVQFLSLYYLCAGLCQILAGAAMLKINERVKAHFRSAEGERTIAAALELSTFQGTLPGSVQLSSPQSGGSSAPTAAIATITL